MTILDIANRYNVSVQAVYKRIKRAGLSLESLKMPGNTSELTPDGARTVLSLYVQNNPVNSTAIDTPGAVQSELIASITIERDELKARCSELTEENAALKAETAEARKTIAALTDQLARLTEQAMQQAATAQRLADQAQQLHALQLKALPQPTSNPLRRWLHNITGKNKSSEADA